MLSQLLRLFLRAVAYQPNVSRPRNFSMEPDFCWRLFLAEDDLEGLELDSPVVSLQYLLARPKLHPTRRFEYHDDTGVVHAWISTSKNVPTYTAHELLHRLDPDSVVGAWLEGPSSPAPNPPDNVYTLVGWPGYYERLYQWMVGRKRFRDWDDVGMFQAKTGGWCYLNLISRSPAQASNFARTRGMTMSWPTIIPLAHVAGTTALPFALNQTTGLVTHITMSAGGSWTVQRIQWILQNPAQATAEQRALVGAVIGHTDTSSWSSISSCA
ncbi:hypothetical protein B0H15DRAFT_40780 [Mycena belliarum]|uniref:Uncharacterized protein n=1 Tax=Mycena belliarum TaxID=1033014 RepID=A0AAD6TP50_9AGAR|nr:hypothetical protein B0H15DRAFT_40780 [Mycena belliae]